MRNKDTLKMEKEIRRLKLRIKELEKENGELKTKNWRLNDQVESLEYEVGYLR